MSKDKEIKSIKDIENIDSFDDLEKAILTIAFLLQKTSDRELKKILIEYRKQLDSIRQELSYAYVNNSTQDLNGELVMSYQNKYKVEKQINKSIKNNLDKLSEYEQTILSLALYQAYKDTYYKANDAINKYKNNKDYDNTINYDDIYNDETDIELLDSDEVERIVNQSFKGDIYPNRVIKNNRLLQLELASVIKQGLEQNKSIYILNQEVKEVFNKSAYRSKRLLDTESFRVFNLALLSVYAYNKIEKVRYNAILDNRTCQTCSGYDNEVFLIDDAPSLPQHSLCRCYYSSVI